MNFEADDLLAHVDEWKFQLHDKLKGLNAEQRAAFWAKAREGARAAGLPLAEAAGTTKRSTKRAPRRTG